MTRWPYPRYAAHRGAGTLAPENTLAAMRVGFAHGYRMVEFDVKLSADGVPFLLHDDTLDRTPNGRGPADAMSWAELSRLDAGSWHSPAFAREPLPTLAAVAHWAIASEVACNIEIKPMPGREAATGTAVALAARALWRDAPPLRAVTVMRAEMRLPRRSPPRRSWSVRCSLTACLRTGRRACRGSAALHSTPTVASSPPPS